MQHFDTWTSDRASGGKFRPLLLDSHRSHYNLPFCRYAYDHKIILMSYPGHSTHLLQPLDVGLFSPLQKAYSKAASDFVRDTRTGTAKGTFWKFYRQAKKTAFTKETSKEHGMVLVSILSTPMRSLPGSLDISEVHHYPPPPLNLSSSSKYHTTAETSASRPSTLLLLSAQIQRLLPMLPLHSYVALPTRVKLP